MNARNLNEGQWEDKKDVLKPIYIHTFREYQYNASNYLTLLIPP